MVNSRSGTYGNDRELQWVGKRALNVDLSLLDSRGKNQAKYSSSIGVVLEAHAKTHSVSRSWPSISLRAHTLQVCLTSFIDMRMNTAHSFRPPLAQFHWAIIKLLQQSKVEKQAGNTVFQCVWLRIHIICIILVLHPECI